MMVHQKDMKTYIASEEAQTCGGGISDSFHEPNMFLSLVLTPFLDRPPLVQQNMIPQSHESQQMRRKVAL